MGLFFIIVLIFAAGSAFSVAYESYQWAYVGAIPPNCQAHSVQFSGYLPCPFPLCAGCCSRSL